MDNPQNKLTIAIDENQIIEFDRSPEIEEKVRGYVVAVSDLFVMLHFVDYDFIALNGYSVLRSEDIRQYRVMEEHDSFLSRALRIKGVRPIPQPEIDLSDVSTLLSSADAHFPLVTIHRELIDAEICFIGRVQKLTNKTLILNEIDPAAKWEGTRRHNLKDITRIDLGGNYEEALALVAEHEAKK